MVNYELTLANVGCNQIFFLLLIWKKKSLEKYICNGLNIISGSTFQYSLQVLLSESFTNEITSKDIFYVHSNSR